MIEKGFYWIKIFENSEWCIAEFNGEYFSKKQRRDIYDSTNRYEPDEIFEISERINVEFD
jgi:elongation factor P hydroxylase